MAGEIRFGVIGAGRIGKIHAVNVVRATGARLVAVADSRLDAAREAAALAPDAGAFDDARRVLDDSAIDAVVIASPTPTHAELIEAAAATGKHVLCEKPIDLDLERARLAIARADAAGIVLQIGFNRRFDPTFRRIADLARDGTVGNVELVRITSRDPAPPPAEYVRTSGGIFLDMSIHDLDMARFVAHDEPESVFATGSVLVDDAIGRAGDVDTVAIVLRYRSGALGLIDNSRRAVYGYDQRVEVFGSAGCVVNDHHTETSVRRLDSQAERREPPLHFFLERYRESYVLELEEFVRCVREGLPPEPSGADGLRAIELAVCAARSLRETRPVRVDEVARKSQAA